MGVTGKAIYQDELYKIKKADEKQWINDVIGRKRDLCTLTDRPIECPKEYEAYYETTLERRRRRLEKQLEFLRPRRNGLRKSIIFVTNSGNNPQPGLEKAYREYVVAIAEAESKLHEFNYIMKDFHVTEDAQNAESSDT